MVKKISSGDFHIINGVLKTAHSLFKRLCGIQVYVSCSNYTVLMRKPSLLIIFIPPDTGMNSSRKNFGKRSKLF